MRSVIGSGRGAGAAGPGMVRTIRFNGNLIFVSGVGGTIANRLQRSDVGDDRFEIVGRHRAEVVVRHQRKERAAVARDAFGDRAYQLAVGPFTNSRRRDVRRVQRRDADVEHRAATFGARLQRPGKTRPVARAVTHDTARDVPREIFAARDLLGRGRRLSRWKERRRSEARERDTRARDLRDQRVRRSESMRYEEVFCPHFTSLGGSTSGGVVRRDSRFAEKFLKAA